MVPPRRFVIAAVAAVAVVGLGVGVVIGGQGDPDEPAGPRVVQPGAPGQPGRTLSPEEVADLSPPPHTLADILFMQRMVSHHEQALEMTALVAGRSDGPDLASLAERIEISQRDEIAQMGHWLDERGAEGPGPHASHAPHDMPGMLSDDQLSQLEHARGAEFDRLFLEFMIRHHEGALTMVQQLYAAGGGLEPASDRFAREVVADQTIEINRMRSLLGTLSG
jgi:uncharacterized protein (DUF305 family)